MLTGTGHNYSTLKNNFSPSFYNNHGGDEDDHETPHQFFRVLLLSRNDKGPVSRKSR